MGAAIVSMFFAFLRGLPSWLLIAGITSASWFLYYEGFPPPPFPDRLPLIGSISIFDGRVDRVRNAADERCRLQKVESKRMAERADQIEQTKAAQRRAEQERAAAGELAAALAEKESYANEIDDLDEKLQICRRATDADVRRLR